MMGQGQMPRGPQESSYGALLMEQAKTSQAALANTRDLAAAQTKFLESATAIQTSQRRLNNIASFTIGLCIGTIVFQTLVTIGLR